MQKVIIPIIALILIACSKEEIQAPQQPKCMGATFYFEYYRDQTFKELLYTIPWHHHEVCDEILESYKKIPLTQPCPLEPMLQRIVLAVDTCKKATK